MDLRAQTVKISDTAVRDAADGTPAREIMSSEWWTPWRLIKVEQRPRWAASLLRRWLELRTEPTVHGTGCATWWMQCVGLTLMGSLERPPTNRFLWHPIP